mmetsp:Transcript_49879/g.113282  ORF Transcript_49879/g.113282 Transcript_49879/m.113282 type:complete len:202 (-) Transcript_49879:583-1188(-)
MTTSGAMGEKQRQIMSTMSTWAKCLPYGSQPGLLNRRMPINTLRRSRSVASRAQRSHRVSMWNSVRPRSISTLSATQALIMMYCVKKPDIWIRASAIARAASAGCSITLYTVCSTVPLIMLTKNTFTTKNHAIRSSCRTPLRDQVRQPSKKPSPEKSGGRRLEMTMRVKGSSAEPALLRVQCQPPREAYFSICTGPNSELR